MKKTLFNVAVMLLIGICAFAATSTIEIEKPTLKYIINGKEVEMPDGEQGFLYNNRTYVPIRFIAEALDKDVSWDNDTSTVIISDKQPDSYKLENGVLTNNGKEVDLSYLSEYGEIELRKVYDNILVFTKEYPDDFYINVYKVYYTDLTTKEVQFIDEEIRTIGGIYPGPMKNFYYYESTDSSMAMFDMKTLKRDDFADEHTAHSLIWDNETAYFSSLYDDGIYVKAFGEESRCIANINIDFANLFLDGNRLICYNKETDKGCIIDSDSNKIISEQLTKAEKNSVILRRMLKFNDVGHDEYGPELTSVSPFANLEYFGISNGNIIFKSSVAVNKNSYPKSVTLENTEGKLELILDVYGDDMAILNLELLDSKDKDTVTEIILERVN